MMGCKGGDGTGTGSVSTYGLGWWAQRCVMSFGGWGLNDISTCCMYTVRVISQSRPYPSFGSPPPPYSRQTMKFFFARRLFLLVFVKYSHGYFGGAPVGWSTKLSSQTFQSFLLLMPSPPLITKSSFNLHGSECFFFFKLPNGHIDNSWSSTQILASLFIAFLLNSPKPCVATTSRCWLVQKSQWD